MSAIEEQRVLAQLEGENLEEKIELIVRQTGQGSSTLEIRSLHWGDGVGWYVQKTINLAPTQVSRLAHLLHRSSIIAPKKPRGGKIIPFPHP